KDYTTGPLITTEYVYTGSQVIEEYKDTVLSKTFVYADYIDDPIVMTKGSNRYYYIKNRQYAIKAYVPEADYSISTSSSNRSHSLDLGVLIGQESNYRMDEESSFSGPGYLVADSGPGKGYDLISASQSLLNNEYSVKKISDQIQEAFYKRRKDVII
ncbi:MAG: hypothetical protein KKE44_05150, partial [Proteobacteria bacterium]|nr:hypothetical protein [Pseudomonadota bacterium]